jgi:ATP-dependent helicase/nuclease subunit A
VKDAGKTVEKWEEAASRPDWLLEDYTRASANSYLEWIGPALARHRDAASILGNGMTDRMTVEELAGHPSRWQIHIYEGKDVAGLLEEENLESEVKLEKVRAGAPILSPSSYAEAVRNQLSWKYSYNQSATHRSKQSVTEMKRNHEVRDAESGTDLLRAFSKPILNRPRFMQEKKLTPAEKGTAMHMVMQHIDLGKPITEQTIREQLDQMAESELLYPEQRDGVEIEWILAFFDTGLGQRLLKADKVKREVPFYLSLPADQVYPDWKEDEEQIFIQGVVDCVFEDSKGLVLLDFKTDSITDRYKGGFEQARPILEERYQIQLALYAKALEQIWKIPVEERYLYFFDGGHLLRIGMKG